MDPEGQSRNVVRFAVNMVAAAIFSGNFRLCPAGFHSVIIVMAGWDTSQTTEFCKMKLALNSAQEQREVGEQNGSCSCVSHSF